MRTLLAILLCACTITTTGGCIFVSMGGALATSAVYRKDVPATDAPPDVQPWVGPDTRAERYVVERFDFVKGGTYDWHTLYWKFPGDLSRVSRKALRERIGRFDPQHDPTDPRPEGSPINTVVCLRPVVVLQTELGAERPGAYDLQVRTWTDFDPEVRWFSPDMDVHPTPPVFDAPDRAHIDVPWGRLVLTRERIMQSDSWQGYRLRWSWVVTTEPPPKSKD